MKIVFLCRFRVGGEKERNFLIHDSRMSGLLFSLVLPTAGCAAERFRRLSPHGGGCLLWGHAMAVSSVESFEFFRAATQAISGPVQLNASRH